MVKSMHKLYSLLGLCQRAGKLVSGEVGCEQAVRSKTAVVILLAEDASANTRKKFQNAGAFYEVPMVTVGTKEELGRAIGKESRAVIAVTEAGFGKKILELSEQMR